MADFAKVWQAGDKVVYSTTLQAVSTARTRLERSFDPDAVRDMKRSATGDLTVGGANLARTRSRTGWSTSVTCSSVPCSSVAASRRCRGTLRAELELVDERRFASGVVYLRYRNPI